MNCVADLHYSEITETKELRASYQPHVPGPPFTPFFPPSISLVIQPPLKRSMTVVFWCVCGFILEVSRLRFHFLAIDIAVPWTGIEGDVILDWLEASCRTAVWPASIEDLISRKCYGVIGGHSFPFTITRTIRLLQQWHINIRLRWVVLAMQTSEQWISSSRCVISYADNILISQPLVYQVVLIPYVGGWVVSNTQ